MRALHRDVGFLVIGLTVIYALSGIVFIFRDTDIFKQKVVIEKSVAQHLKPKEINKALRLKGLKVIKKEDDTLHFKAKEYVGSYDPTTGKAIYSRMEYPLALKKLNQLHKTKQKANDESIVHWFATVYGVLLMFLAISSFWMFKPGSKLFKRGLIISIVGGLGAIVLMYYR